MVPTKRSIERIIDEYTDGEILNLSHFEEKEKRDISNEDIIKIASALKEKPVITSLTLTLPSLTSEIAKALINTGLKKLSLVSCGINMEAIATLAEGDLEVLTIAGCDATDEEIGSLFLSHSLKKLILSHNQIEGKALQNLAHNSSLTFLDLSYNMIKDEYCRYIGLNHSLQILYLNGNEIGDEGLQALSLSSSLEKIYLMHGNVTTICPLSPSLRKLVLIENNVKSINQLLDRMPLEEINLIDNPISEQDYTQLKKHYPRAAGLIFYGETILSKRKADTSGQENESNKKNFKI